MNWEMFINGGLFVVALVVFFIRIERRFSEMKGDIAGVELRLNDKIHQVELSQTRSESELKMVADRQTRLETEFKAFAEKQTKLEQIVVGLANRNKQA